MIFVVSNVFSNFSYGVGFSCYSKIIGWMKNLFCFTLSTCRISVKQSHVLDNLIVLENVFETFCENYEWPCHLNDESVLFTFFFIWPSCLVCFHNNVFWVIRKISEIDPALKKKCLITIPKNNSLWSRPKLR